MKLVCNVTVNNCLFAGQSGKPKSRSVKSTLALCKHPNSDKYSMILFNGQNKNGVKYDLKENVLKVVTKFANEGKTTIQFKNPRHDFFIQADVIALKSFLHLLQRIFKGDVAPNECSSLAVTSIKQRDMAPTQLTIKSRSQYPQKGLPRTLEDLTITGINARNLDEGILRLTKLKILDLSGNCLSKFPKEISQMVTLQALDISSNEFHKSNIKDWEWLSGNLLATLCSLNLAGNRLTFVPVQITKLKRLISLNLSDNELLELPSSVIRLGRLKVLKVSGNHLAELPGSMRCFNLDALNVSENPLGANFFNRRTPAVQSTFRVFNLKVYAAQTVLQSKIPYNSQTIPATLVKYLDEDAEYCVCGKASFNVYSRRTVSISLLDFAKGFIAPAGYSDIFVPMACSFCSCQCSNLYQRK